MRAKSAAWFAATAAVPLFLQGAAAAPQPLSAAADRLVAEYARPGAPGCALGVIQQGRFSYRRAYGIASLELGTPLSPDSVFYLGSISKQFTAASIVIAQSKGLLSLDDDVRKWIPELPDYGRPITIVNLLHHTSGLADYYGLLYLAGRDETDRHSNAELLDLIVRQKQLDFPTGERFEYSNSNYLLLAEIVRRASGQSLAAFAQANIFAPLGMAHTRYLDDAGTVLPGRTPAYMPGPDGSYRIGWSTNFDAIGAGGAYSTLGDLLLWDRNFYDNRLAAHLPETMQVPGTLNDGTRIDYALGLFVRKWRGFDVVEHTGSLFGYRNYFLRIPSRRLSVIVLCNASNAKMQEQGRRLASLFLGLTPEPPKPAQQPDPPTPVKASTAASPLQAYAGTYRSDALDARYEVQPTAAGLILRRGWMRPLLLAAAGGDRFGGEAFELSFTRDDAGTVTGLVASVEGSPGHAFDRVPR